MTIKSKKSLKALLALTLSLVMLFGMLPFDAFADNDGYEQEYVEDIAVEDAADDVDADPATAVPCGLLAVAAALAAEEDAAASERV